MSELDQSRAVEDKLFYFSMTEEVRFLVETGLVFVDLYTIYAVFG